MKCLPKMEFERHVLVSIKAGYVTQKDWELMIDPNFKKCAFRVMVNSEPYWGSALFYIHTTIGKGELEDNLRHITEELDKDGFSERMIHIMQEARRQRIDYVRFDTDGGEVKNLKTIEE
jgi:hypothetical protein